MPSNFDGKRPLWAENRKMHGQNLGRRKGEQTKVARSRKQGPGDKPPRSTAAGNVLLEGDPRRRFAYFAAAGKVGRPQGGISKIKVGATESVTPTGKLYYGRRGEAKLRTKLF